MLNTTGQAFKCWLLKELMFYTTTSNFKLNPAFYINNTKNTKIFENDARSQSERNIYFQVTQNFDNAKVTSLTHIKKCLYYL